MTFMMTSSNNDKSDIFQFYYEDLFRIINTVYVQHFMENGQKFSEIQHVFSPWAYSPPTNIPALRFSKKPNSVRVKVNNKNIKKSVKYVQDQQ